MKITAEKFREATGHEPINDDLKRANCEEIGQFGHFMCGWDKERDLPRWMVPFLEPELTGNRNDR